MIVYGLYLRKDMVYIPTKAETPSGSYREIEPVSVVPVSKTEDLRAALKECIARGNPPLKSYSPTDQAVVLKYAGVGSFSSFARGAQPWTIVLKDGVYEIRGQRKRSDKGWEQDPNNTIVFPASMAEDSVVEKMIQILQKPNSSGESRQG